MKRLEQALRTVNRHHLGGCVVIVLALNAVLSVQIADRTQFADSELRRDVMERWGAPIVQPAPSLRYVPSGTVFTSLAAMALESQDIQVAARMSYRKRGLIYFSGFELDFSGTYVAKNAQEHDIDVVFVFPVSLDKNQVLLSDLNFAVDGVESPIQLAKEGDKLVWTGRLEPGAERRFKIHFSGRGLDQFTYVLDPSMPVRQLTLQLGISGGSNYDYAFGVVPATSTRSENEQTQLEWRFTSLESGVPLGVTLPSIRSYDQLVATMARRSLASFLLFWAVFALLLAKQGRSTVFYESYMVAAGWGLFPVLLAYLAAFLPFAPACAFALVLISSLLVWFTGRLVPGETRQLTALVAASLWIPTLAILLEGYTGLVYTLEIFALLAATMHLATQGSFKQIVARLLEEPIAENAAPTN